MANRNGVNPLATGVAGAIIGAAAAAAAMVLSDEKNRKKAEKVLGELEKDGSKVIKEITRIALELKDKGVKALPKARGLTAKVITKAKTKKVASKKKK